MKRTIAGAAAGGTVAAVALLLAGYRVNQNTTEVNTASQGAYASCVGSNLARADVDKKFDKLAVLIQAQVTASDKKLTPDQRRYVNDLLRTLREPVHRSACKP